MKRDLKVISIFIIWFLGFYVFIHGEVSILVLGYHKIIAPGEEFTCPLPQRVYLELREDVFRKQVEWISKEGYKNLTKKGLESFFTSPSNFPSGKYVLFTFDDGYKSVIKNVFPILKKYGYTGIVFIVPSVIGKKVWNNDHLNIEDLKELLANGWAVEDHTHHHLNLKKVKHSEIEDELRLSKSWFRENLGYSPSLLAYPQGGYKREVIKILQQNGYKFAFTTHSKILKNNKKRYTIGRYFPLLTDRLRKFIAKIRRMER